MMKRILPGRRRPLERTLARKYGTALGSWGVSPAFRLSCTGAAFAQPRVTDLGARSHPQVRDMYGLRGRRWNQDRLQLGHHAYDPYMPMQRPESTCPDFQHVEAVNQSRRDRCVAFLKMHRCLPVMIGHAASRIWPCTPAIRSNRRRTAVRQRASLQPAVREPARPRLLSLARPYAR
jgi:hypothetical protein